MIMFSYRHTITAINKVFLICYPPYTPENAVCLYYIYTWEI
ncbi:hypothetical protein Lederberg_26 [Pelagibacter phage Lederberg EXVC029P]|nr:hypothetical protein Lederberg_26 [Pelagibacter phage Lederberg EXVC029P]